ncbi:copper resistance protein [Erwinia sorbitola]|uniref:Copper resistance protein n=1 Tax=Erwinia sorbitola TaxID=2681984 RepID=A0A6I6EV73_9GAMM|nr:copper resistance protein [Erwinia sorbitola]MTD26918.1 copper resistance protein [Erwinia sorbitola]QGU88482.1 copper resistance protein [Erwinia sorbitola]
MATRQRIAGGFLALACLVILVCMAQRVASLHALQMPLAPASSSTGDTLPNSADEPATSPCELSGKTLLLAMPLLFESALPAVAILLLVLAVRCTLPLIFPPPRSTRAPLLRIHLLHCNFRE